MSAGVAVAFGSSVEAGRNDAAFVLHASSPFISPAVSAVRVGAGAGAGGGLAVASVVGAPGSAGVRLAGGALLVGAPLEVAALADAVPQPQPFEVFAVASPTGSVTEADVVGFVRTGALPVGTPTTGPITSQSNIAMSVAGLNPDTAYDLRLVAWDAANDSAAVTTATLSTEADAMFGLFSFPSVGMTLASVSNVVTDPDSTTRIVMGLADPADNVVDFASNIRSHQDGALTKGGALWLGDVPPSASGAPFLAQFSNLAPATAYRAVVSAEDMNSGNVTYASSVVVGTLAAWGLDDIIVTDVGYSNAAVRVDAIVSAPGSYGTAQLQSTVIPDTAQARADWVAAGADPLALLTTRTLSNLAGQAQYVTHDLLVTAGLEDGADYLVAAKIVPGEEPWLKTEAFQGFTTPSLPVATVEITNPEFIGGQQFFYDARADVDVAGANFPFNAYVCVVERTKLTEDVVALLLAQGSSAYPGTFVDNNQVSPYSCKAVRNNLTPGIEFKVVVLLTFPHDLSPDHFVVQELNVSTAPLPEIEMAVTDVVNDALQVTTTATAATAFDLQLAVTSNVIGGFPQLVPQDVIDGNVPATQTFLAREAFSFVTSFSNLVEGTEYGVMAVTSAAGLLLNVESTTTRTGVTTGIALAVTSVGTGSVDYSVSCVDSDSSFDLFTVVTGSAFSQADAEELLASGMAYAGGVPGTVTVHPNDSAQTQIELDVSASKLAHDSPYFVAAVVRDDMTGVVSFATTGFLTDFQPELEIQSVRPSTTSAGFDVYSRDRDAALDVYWVALPSRVGVTAELVSAHPAAAHASTAGPGAQVLPALVADGLQGGSAYELAVAVFSSRGHSALAFQAFSTFSAPVISFEGVSVLSTSVSVSVAAADPDAGDLFDMRAVLLPGAPAVDAAAAALISAGAGPAALQQKLAVLTGAAAYDLSFASMDPGEVYTVAATVTDRLGGDVNFASRALTTRVRPELVPFAAASTRSSVSAGFSLTLPEVLPARWNEVRYVATVAPADSAAMGALPGWFDATGSDYPASNPDLPGAAVVHGTRAAAGALSATVTLDAESLLANSRYDLVVRACDALDGSNLYEASLAVFTRSEISVSLSLTSASLTTTTWSYSAHVLDGGTATVRAHAFPNPASLAEPTPEQRDAAAAGGTLLSAAQTFAGGSVDLAGLQSDADYICVLEATDDASGERSGAFVLFRTGAAAPSVSVDAPTLSVTSSAATVVLRVSDEDSAFSLHAGIFAGGTPVDSQLADEVAGGARGELVREFFAPSPAALPVQVTFPDLEPDTPYRVVAVARDVNGNQSFALADVRTVGVSHHRADCEYDGAWALTWRGDVTYDLPVEGLCLGNGKLGAVTRAPASGALVAMDRVMLSGPFEFNAFGGYSNNVARAFDPFVVSLFAHANAPPGERAAVALSEVKMDMFTGVLSQTAEVSDPATGAVVRFESDTAVLRQHAFGALVSLRFTPAQDMEEMRFFHEIGGSPDLSSVVFDATVVNSSSVGPLVVFTADGAVAESSGPGDARAAVSCACTYMFEAPLDAVHGGYNALRHKDHAYNQFTFRNLVAGETYRAHVLVNQGSTTDFARPRADVRRVTIAVRGPDAPAAAAARLRTRHVSAMAGVWGGALTISAKAEATAAERDEVARAQRHARFAQHQILSAMRAETGADLAGAPPAVSDPTGELFYNREMYLLPALLYQKDARGARMLLESSFGALQRAKRLADAHGFRGAMYPFVNDQLEYLDVPYWDVASADYVFKSSLVAVSAFDYFRVTLDRAWLIERGYAILKAVADFLVSRVETTAASEAAGTVELRGVVDVNGRTADNSAFTNYTARLALKGAIEASYELAYFVPASWIATFHGLVVEHHAGALYEVIKQHSEAAPTDTMRILEPLVMLQPHYSREYLKNVSLSTNNESTLLSNAVQYSAMCDASSVSNPYNVLLLAGVFAALARSSPAHADTFASYLSQYTASATRDAWGNVRAPGSGASGGTSDVSLCALLVMVLQCGLAGLTITGGITETGVRYEHTGITGAYATNLPSAWASISVPNVGRGNNTFLVMNERTYGS